MSDLRFGRTLLQRQLPWILALAACCWFLFAFLNYLPGLFPASVSSVWRGTGEVFKHCGIDLLWVLLLWIAAYLAGTRLLTVFGVVPDSRGEKLWLGSSLGLLLISLATLVLAVLKILHRGEAYALVILPLLVWFGELRRMVQSAWKRLSRFRSPGTFSLLSFAHAALIAYTATVLAVILISALGPELDYDPLIMHLVAAKLFAREHALKAIPDIPQTFFPKNITLLFSLGILLHSEIAARLIAYLLGFLSIIGTYVVAAKIFSRTAGLVAAAILASSPLYIWQMRTAHLDSGFALYVFVSLYATLRWLENNQRKWFALAVFCAGFSLGTKYQALFSVASLTAIVLIYRLIERRNAYEALRQASNFFMLSMIGMIPWGIVNLIQTGNPLFPFLNGIFHSPYWTPAGTQLLLTEAKAWGEQITGSNWWVIFTAFWSMTVDQAGKYPGNIGPFYTMFIPLLIFQRKIPSAIKLILGFSFSYWIFWLFTGQLLRYYLGALPGLAVVAAGAIVYFLETVSAKTRLEVALCIAVILGYLAILNTPFFEDRGAGSRIGTAIMPSLPLRYLAGMESRDEYLSRYLGEYPLVQYLNRIPGHKKVLFWWNTLPIAFYLDGDASFVYSYFFSELTGNDIPRMYAVLREHGITHVLIGESSAEAHRFADPNGEFVHRYLKKLYQKNAESLYEVSAVP